MSEVRSALEGLTTHPGWLLFKAEAKRRWGPVGYANELHKAIALAKDNSGNYEAAVLAVQRTCEEMDSLFAWVDSQLRTEQMREEHEGKGQSASRRGPGL